MYLRQPPNEFRDLSQIEGLRMNILYGTAQNFTSQPLPGYGASGAWMLESGFHQLQKVSMMAAQQGLGLFVWDAYRPRRATLAMIRWADSTGNSHLVEEGYIARRSRHNSGAALDLSLYDFSSGELLDMGTEWDCFTVASHTLQTTGRSLQNRLLLQRLMTSHGFVEYEKEWWHFEMQNAGQYSLRDIPYGLSEPDEDSSIC